MGGSFHVEKLTADLAARAAAHIGEIEAMGGMAKAIEAGIPKLRIEEAAARTQARIDSGQQAVIGVNMFRPADDRPVDILKVENAEVRAAQIAKLERLKAERDGAATQAALEALSAGAAGTGNLVELCVAAARARATVGEMSLALERVFGRHRAEIRAISGAYGGEAGAEPVRRVRALAKAFADEGGRAPRILVAKMGQDGHDRGQKVIASAFADLGFEVEIGPLFATPEEAARQAIDRDVHIVGVSTLAAGHLTLVPALKQALIAGGRPDIMIVVGGVVPEQDFAALEAAGAAAIFPPGTIVADAEVDIELVVPEVGEDGRTQRVPKTYRVKIPKGAEDGQRLRLTGKGGAGRNGGPNGDLYIALALQPHPLYRVNGRDLMLDLALAPWEAVLGATVEVPTLTGTVALSIPAGTTAGRKMRLARRGLPSAQGDPGDLYAVIRIEVPSAPSARERELYAELQKDSPFDPRSYLSERTSR